MPAPFTSPPTIGDAESRELITIPQAYAGRSIFGAVGWSPDRSSLKIPTVDTRKEVDAYSRLDLLKSSRKLYRNCAPWMRVVDGIPMMVTGAAGLQPLPMTSDKEWNARARDYFCERGCSRDVFDLGGKWNYVESQRGLLSGELKDGDLFGVLTESAQRRARFTFYEGHQCGDLPKQYGEQNPRFVDGVETNRDNRALAYQFTDGENGVPIGRENVVAFMKYQTRGQNRGVPGCYHWINSGIDVADIDANIRQGIKNASLLGLYEYNSSGDARDDYGVGKKRTTTLSDGSKVTTEDIFDTSRGAVKHTGASRLDVIHDDRPHPNALAYLDNKLRELAMGIGLPPDILFHLAGLRGAEVRLSVAGADVWIKAQQQHLIDTWCSRVYIYTIAKAIKAGDLPACKDPKWWVHGHIAPQRITVDIGRDGALKVREFEERLLTLAQWTAERGGWWETHQDQKLTEEARGAKRQEEIAKEWGISEVQLIAYRKGEAPAMAATEEPTDAE